MWRKIHLNLVERMRWIFAPEKNLEDIVATIESVIQYLPNESKEFAR